VMINPANNMLAVVRILLTVIIISSFLK